ncbi:hypothetical protein CRYUN_Cryun13aG0073200 [Craigia yunnanensis]
MALADLSCQFIALSIDFHAMPELGPPLVQCNPLKAILSNKNLFLPYVGKQVVINGAAKEIGRAAVIAVTKARGMEVAETGVVVDFTMPSAVYDNVKQGCLVAPTLSIGFILLQQAAISAFFHYNNVEIVESRAHATARGQVLVEDRVRVHSMVLPGLPSSTTVYFSGPGEVYTIKHDITDEQCLMPGPLSAVRKVSDSSSIWCMAWRNFYRIPLFFKFLGV